MVRQTGGFGDLETAIFDILLTRRLWIVKWVGYCSQILENKHLQGRISRKYSARPGSRRNSPTKKQLAASINERECAGTRVGTTAQNTAWRGFAHRIPAEHDVSGYHVGE
ncbi:hypothetical protein MGYG_00650 [Nannizzia gypsea CBS 118893]|uniref:Uncharacterized protein n=1 Tax=Arthroderma gypseum (strain ATCC MYA-4604 / CBS 118893) TaxID=535722 RepID=E5R107_ARTGP|nr:hypothetical protein MGYG_00650 [Nannizzia gypsea CBS 118893]EFQ97611.1 hypothetical protein MGYG_00650 [Nannizzia gypsea CBS 118893]